MMKNDQFILKPKPARADFRPEIYPLFFVLDLQTEIEEYEEHVSNLDYAFHDENFHNLVSDIIMFLTIGSERTFGVKAAAHNAVMQYKRDVGEEYAHEQEKVYHMANALANAIRRKLEYMRLYKYNVFPYVIKEWLNEYTILLEYNVNNRRETRAMLNHFDDRSR